MLSKTKMELTWKKVSDHIEVTHFLSTIPLQQIYLKRINASRPGNITFFLFHDICSYHGRFKKLIEWFQLSNPDISFVMMDFGGHGLSSGTRGHLSQFADAVLDAGEFFNYFSKTENEKWFALGNGLGALVLLDLLNQVDGSVKNKINGVVLSNFVLTYESFALNLQNYIFDMLADSAQQSLDHLRLIKIYSPEEILTATNDRVELMEDPLVVHRPTYASLKIITERVKSIYQNAYFLDIPTLVLESSSPYVYSNGMDSFSKGLKKSFLTQKKYLNLRHDLYNESENQSVFKDIVEWMRTWM